MTSIRELRSNVDALRNFMRDSSEPITSRRAAVLTELDRLAGDINESRTFTTKEREDFAAALESLTDRLTK